MNAMILYVLVIAGLLSLMIAFAGMVHDQGIAVAGGFIAFLIILLCGFTCEILHEVSQTNKLLKELLASRKPSPTPQEAPPPPASPPPPRTPPQAAMPQKAKVTGGWG